MPRSTPPDVSAATARLRRLERSLPALSVPALLRVRETLEPLVAGDHVRVNDVAAVLRAAGEG